MKTLLLSSLLVALAGSMSCAPSNDGNAGKGSGSTVGPVGKGSGDDGGDAGTGGAAIEITAFARDLILNEAANGLLPTTTENKNLVDVSPVTFTSAFFVP